MTEEIKIEDIATTIVVKTDLWLKQQIKVVMIEEGIYESAPLLKALLRRRYKELRPTKYADYYELHKDDVN